MIVRVLNLPEAQEFFNAGIEIAAGSQRHGRDKFNIATLGKLIKQVGIYRLIAVCAGRRAKVYEMTW